MAEPDRKWAENPRVAPYVWIAHRLDGSPIGAQFPRGAKDEAPFASIGLILKVRTIIRPDDVHTFVNSTDQTIKMIALPLRDRSVWPTFDHDINPGDALVWCRRVVMPFALNSPQRSVVPQFETFLFGRETASGEVALMQIWPNGEFHEFRTYHDALSTM